MERSEFNKIKNHVLAGSRYCNSVYSKGLESVMQFQAFKKLCQNYVDYCNLWCNKLQPKLGWLQRTRKLQYKELYVLCELSINKLAGLISEFQGMLDKQAEEEEALAMIEARVRLEHAIAVELRDADHTKRLELSRVHPIGYSINREKINDDKNDI